MKNNAHHTLFRHLATGTALLGLVACGRISDSETLDQSTLESYRFENITPTGQRIFSAALRWMDQQVNSPTYPQPKMCANNVSKVLQMAGLSGYSADGVGAMVNKAERKGSRTVHMQKDKASVLAALNSIYNGRIPTGALVNGCLSADCVQKPGDAHISILGNIDSQGRILLYHNNWYRPENNGGVWAPYMVSKHFYYDLGYKRQWMPTPWLKLERDGTGKIVDVKSVLPQIDDLDPFQYYVTITIIPEIAAESQLAKRTDGKGNVWNLSAPNPKVVSQNR